MNFNKDKIILGCGNFGGVGSSPSLKGMGEGPAEVTELVHTALDLGIHHFDTANTYGGGLSEAYLGNVLHELGPQVRSKIQIQSKVGNPAGLSKAEHPLDAKEIEYHIHESLRRLKTDYLDIYYIHEVDSKTSIQSVLCSLDRLIQKGLIRFFGFSNVDLKFLKQLIEQMDHRMKSFFHSIQNEYNYLKIDDQERIIPFLLHLGVGYSAYSPLAGGLLTGKYRFDQPAPEKSRLALRPEPYAKFLNKESFQRISELEQQALSMERKLPEQALRFVIENKNIHSAVIGPRKKKHYEDLGFKFPRS